MTDDLTAREERVRVEAARLWEAAGRPEGRDEEFWHAAEAVVRQQEAARVPRRG